MKKSDLRSGMFGKTSNGDVFVVAGDKLIYQDGTMDELAYVDGDLYFPNGVHIASLYEADCYGDFENGSVKEIWHRPEPKSEPVDPMKEMGKTTITITLEQYAEALERASKKFAEVAAEDKVDPVTFMIMSTQNITFGTLIADELFGKYINEDNKEDK